MSHQHNSTTALSFIVGTGIGIAAGVLLAPRSGQETRGKIKDHVRQSRAKAIDKMHEQRNKMQDQAEKIREKASEAVNTAEQKVTAGRQAVKETVEEVKARADQKSLADAYKKK